MTIQSLEWTSVSSVERTILVDTTQPVAEAGGSAVLIGGLAIGALVMMMSKKK